MRLDRIDLNLFVVFDTVYKERNLTRAAEILCLSQPAVSNALSRLRKTLNDELFIRSSKGMIPTPVAENIIERLRDALLLIEETVNTTEQFDPLEANKTFRVSMSDYAQSLMLPTLMAQLNSLAPNMAIESYYLPRKEQSRALMAGQLDLAIDAPLLQDKQLQHQTLVKSSHVCVLDKNNPASNEPLTMESYLKMQHIHVSSRQRGAGYIDTVLHSLGAERSILLRVAHYLLIPHILKSTELVATVPAALAAQLKLPTTALPFETQPFELHMYWHKSVEHDPANKWLRELMINLQVLKNNV